MPIISPGKRPSSRDFEPGAEALLVAADTAQQTMLVQLAGVELGKLRMLAQEVARASHKYGTTSPEAERLRRQQQAQELVVKGLAAEAARASTPEVKLSAEEKVVHGRVVDAELAVVRSVRVEAVDASGKVVASGTTDEQGYYNLRFAGGAAAAALKLVVRAGDQAPVEQPVEPPPAGTALWREVIMKRS